VRHTFPQDGHDVQMQTNQLSHFLLSREVLPLLDKAAELRGEVMLFGILRYCISHTLTYAHEDGYIGDRYN
jgi:hypothetical protein